MLVVWLGRLSRLLWGFWGLLSFSEGIHTSLVWLVGGKRWVEEEMILFRCFCFGDDVASEQADEGV